MIEQQQSRRVDECRELIEFNRWATARVLDAVAELPAEDFTRALGSSFPSVRDTLVHVMSAEWVWLARCTGTSPTAMPEEWKQLDLATLRTTWDGVHAALRAFVDGLDDAALDRAHHYRNLAGQAATSLLAQILRHVVNHSTYHRGQVVTMLRQLGAAAPATDLIAFYRAVQAESGAR
jgi:uncharacterized damage-inducible protein DinB